MILPGESFSKKGLTKAIYCDIIYKSVDEACFWAGYDRFRIGEVSEWFKEPVLKTGDPARDRGFESHPLRQSYNVICYRMEMYSSGDEAPLLRA